MVPAMANNDDDELMTYSAAAKLLGRNRRTVWAALEGMTPDRPSKDGRPARWKLGTVKAALDRRAVANADYIRNGASSSTASLTRARARLASNKAAIVEMQRRKLEGELVRADEVERAWASMIATARARLLAIPSKCAAKVGMCKTTAEVATILRQEVHEALDELSRSGSGRQDDGPAGAAAAR